MAECTTQLAGVILQTIAKLQTKNPNLHRVLHARALQGSEEPPGAALAAGAQGTVLRVPTAGQPRFRNRKWAHFQEHGASQHGRTLQF